VSRQAQQPAYLLLLPSEKEARPVTKKACAKKSQPLFAAPQTPDGAKRWFVRGETGWLQERLRSQPTPGRSLMEPLPVPRDRYKNPLIVKAGGRFRQQTATPAGTAPSPKPPLTISKAGDGI
jgi:hypothetical protein